jgi:hypothetical protein
MSVICANVVHFVTTHPLEANPDIRLDIFHQMPNMNLAIGVWQGGGN